MGVKLHLFLLLAILGITVYAAENQELPRCDWPRGVCTYINDPCPPDIPIDCRYQMYCPVSTNKCCCRY